MLAAFDAFLMDARPRRMHRLRRGLIEFLYFGFKNARSCLFVFTFIAAHRIENPHRRGLIMKKTRSKGARIAIRIAIVIVVLLLASRVVRFVLQ
jgi:uncharacterized membrane protein YoaT (DUF817 family)